MSGDTNIGIGRRERIRFLERESWQWKKERSSATATTAMKERKKEKLKNAEFPSRHSPLFTSCTCGFALVATATFRTIVVATSTGAHCLSIDCCCCCCCIVSK